MVRLILMMLLCGPAAPARAQVVDWSAAGGDLFGTAVPVKESAEDQAVRLVPPRQLFQDAVDEAALSHGLDPKLLHALVVTESGYRPAAVSPAGAGGLTQLMPATAAALGVADRFDPAENLRGGAAYLAQQLMRFGDVRLALAAYNAGPARVARHGGVPDIAETRAYVATVIDCYLALTAGRTVSNPGECAAGDAR